MSEQGAYPTRPTLNGLLLPPTGRDVEARIDPERDDVVRLFGVTGDGASVELDVTEVRDAWLGDLEPKSAEEVAVLLVERERWEQQNSGGVNPVVVSLRDAQRDDPLDSQLVMGTHVSQPARSAAADAIEAADIASRIALSTGNTEDDDIAEAAFQDARGAAVSARPVRTIGVSGSPAMRVAPLPTVRDPRTAQRSNQARVNEIVRMTETLRREQHTPAPRSERYLPQEQPAKQPRIGEL